MKKLIGMVVAAALATPAWANDVAQVDGTWVCRTAGGEVIKRYEPAGRVPTEEEKAACAAPPAAAAKPKAETTTLGEISDMLPPPAKPKAPRTNGGASGSW